MEGLSGQPLLEGLLDSFDLAAGGGVVGPGVLLHDVSLPEFGLEPVAAPAAAGEPGRVDHAVVGQCGSPPRSRCLEAAIHRPHHPRHRGPDPSKRPESVVEPGATRCRTRPGSPTSPTTGSPSPTALRAPRGDPHRLDDHSRICCTCPPHGASPADPWSRPSPKRLNNTGSRWVRCQPMVSAPASRPCSDTPCAVADQLDRLRWVALGVECGRRERGSNAASPSALYRAMSLLIQPCETP